MALDLYIEYRLQHWALASALGAELRAQCGGVAGPVPDDAPILALNLANILEDRLATPYEAEALGRTLGLTEEQVREALRRVE
jgi:hypothetical protein